VLLVSKMPAKNIGCYKRFPGGLRVKSAIFKPWMEHGWHFFMIVVYLETVAGIEFYGFV